MPETVHQVTVAGDVALSVGRWAAPEVVEAVQVLVPVVLVHGLASNRRLWDGVAPALARAGHQVATLDLRGHGSSDKPDTGYDFATMTDDLVAVADALGFDHPLVVGQSMGAELAVELAWRFPDRAAGVACIDGGWFDLQARFPDWEDCLAALRPPSTTGRALADIEAMVRSRHPDWPEAGIAGTLACFEHRSDATVAPLLTEQRHLALLRALWERRPSTRYPGVSAPVLLVPARPASGLSPQREQVEAACRALAQVQVRWMVGDHDLHAQHPAAVAAVVHHWAAAELPPRSAGPELAPVEPSRPSKEGS